MKRLTKAERRVISDAARSLRAIPSSARSAASARNGACGGRPRSGFLSERDMRRVVLVVASDLCLDSRQTRTLRECAVSIRHEAIREHLDIDRAAHRLQFHPSAFFRSPVTSDSRRLTLPQCKQILAGLLL